MRHFSYYQPKPRLGVVQIYSRFYCLCLLACSTVPLLCTVTQPAVLLSDSLHSPGGQTPRPVHPSAFYQPSTSSLAARLASLPLPKSPMNTPPLGTAGFPNPLLYSSGRPLFAGSETDMPSKEPPKQHLFVSPVRRQLVDDGRLSSEDVMCHRLKRKNDAL